MVGDTYFAYVMHRACEEDPVDGTAQHPLEQKDVDFPIVDDQDVAVKNVN
jgi:hypothetical protein